MFMLPDAASVLALEPEELGGVLLEHFNSMTAQEQFQLSRHNFLMSQEVFGYGRDPQDRLGCAFAEAWAWLERECLIALKPNAGGSYGYFITRRGQKLIDRNASEAYRRASMLPRSFPHPRIESRVYPSFLRGAYARAGRGDMGVQAAKNMLQLRQTRISLPQPGVVGESPVYTNQRRPTVECRHNRGHP